MTNPIDVNALAATLEDMRSTPEPDGFQPDDSALTDAARLLRLLMVEHEAGKQISLYDRSEPAWSAWCNHGLAVEAALKEQEQ